MSALRDFLNEHGIQPEQVAQQSVVMEAKTTDDQALHVKRESARRLKKSYDEFEAPKPDRMGRGLSPRIMNAALEGRPLTRKNRMRVVRAVNALLTQASKDTVETAQLFSDTPKKVGKKK